MLIGQENLTEKLKHLINSDNLPNTILFVGPRGQGKKTLAGWLANQLGASLYIPEDVKIDSIREVNADSRTISSPKVYLLADAEDMTIQAQNALLKLSEEPPEHAYIVITVQDTNTLLPTILSRSITFRLDGYSFEELNVFTTDVDLMKLAKNPGNIKRLASFDYHSLLKHAGKVVDNIGKISAVNAFNILRTVDKANYDIFLEMLIHSYGQRLPGLVCGKQLAVLYETKTQLERSKSINKQNALEMMLIRLREAARNEVQ
jgi:replication-associated recombination protein RarA